MNGIIVDKNKSPSKKFGMSFSRLECQLSLLGGRNSTMSSVTSLAIVFLLLIVGGQSDGKPEERKNLKTIFDLLIGISNGFYSETNGTGGTSRLDCPLCDSSVYSYCSEKLLHDACCCLNPYEHKLPHQCKYADCGFLHANSCREHKLITACCCSKLL